MSTILIVDDDPVARETLVAMLEEESYDLQLANDGMRALKMLEQLQPDLILLDVLMPGLDGFEVCRRIRSTPPLAEVPILLLTALDDLLTKPADRRELTARVRTIIRLNRYQTLLEQRENIRHMAERVVGAQEKEILQLIAEQYTSAEIGKMLFISEKTVEKHRTRLMEKLNVRNLAGLVRMAVKYHLVDKWTE